MIAILLVAAPSSGASEAEGSAAFQFVLARSLGLEGDVDEALAAWEELLQLEIDDVYVRVEYARFLSDIGRFGEASVQAQEARRLAPQNTDVLRAAADVHIAARRAEPGSADRAVESLEALVKLQPANVEALVDLGRLLLLDLDKPEEAAAALTSAVQHRPGSRMIQSFLVEAWMRASKRPEAELALSRFLESDPEFLRGRLMLARRRANVVTTSPPATPCSEPLRTSARMLTCGGSWRGSCIEPASSSAASRSWMDCWKSLPIRSRIGSSRR